VGFALRAPGVFCEDASLVLTSMPVLCLKDGWGLLYEPWRVYARVIVCFDLCACPLS
jgi:hypothetical protein